MAVAQNEQAAILVGIQPAKVYMITMGVSASLAAVAGILISPILEAVPTMWIFPLFKAFAIVIIGGLGSIGGAIVSAILLGFSETIVSFIFSVKYSDVVYLIAIVLILVLRPRGLFGKK
jgi:branched-chain amino acid transport system permease protein